MDDAHVDRLRDVSAWNAWRAENPDVTPDLGGADLYRADLCGADLYGADLRGADLRGANLYGADLYRADLRDVHMNWNSHDLLAEILRRAAGRIVPRLMLAGLPLVARHLCWDGFLAIDHPEREWALRELARWSTETSPMPDALRAAVDALDAGSEEA